MNDGLRRDLQRLRQFGLEGLRLWQGFGLGGLTSSFTVLSSLGSPFVKETSENGRESRLFRVEAVIPDFCIFDGDIKARKRQGYAPGVETVYYTHTHTHTHTHTQTHTQPYTSPATHGLSYEPLQTHGSILCLLLWTILFRVTADSQDHVGNKNRWLWLKGRTGLGMSLVARGLRSYCPVQGPRLYPWWENHDPTCLEATKPHVLHLLSPRALHP